MSRWIRIIVLLVVVSALAIGCAQRDTELPSKSAKPDAEQTTD